MVVQRLDGEEDGAVEEVGGQLLAVLDPLEDSLLDAGVVDLDVEVHPVLENLEVGLPLQPDVVGVQLDRRASRALRLIRS